jgi:hypothetical protein
MKKKTLSGFVVLFLLFCITGISQAGLTTIGTAQFNGVGTEFNLIWDDNNNGNSVVWLDFSNGLATWENQKSWAAGLTGTLTYNTPGYIVNLGTNSWRLPATVDGLHVFGYEGDPDGDGNYAYTVGYNLANSEMGHLFYTELGNKGYYAIDGTNPQPEWGLKNTGDFDHLSSSDWYWSDTESANGQNFAWYFAMGYNYQDERTQTHFGRGLAIWEGQVSAVPVPGAVWLLGSGIIGLAALRRR